MFTISAFSARSPVLMGHEAEAVEVYRITSIALNPV